MASAVQLTLMIGPAVPVPVGSDVLEALTAATVHTTAGATMSGFELTFTLSPRSPLQTLFLLSGGSVPPLIRVVINVTLNGASQVLMDGVMTSHRVSAASGGAQSTLTVRGKDLTAVMDYLELNGVPYPAMPAPARVALMLAKYAFLGVVPLVIPPFMMDIDIPIERIPRQQGTDLAYIRQLAEQAGYVFYLDPGPLPGMSKAYWGPEIKAGPPQPALNTDMDAHTNVESLSFDFDTESKVMPIVYIQNEQTKVPIPIPIPDIGPLNPPLGLAPPIPHQLKFMDDTAKMSPVRAVLAGMAEASRTSDAVTASGSLDALRYGHALKARQLVGVRGAGMAFDGLYYVRSVTHTLKRGSFKTNFELARNGLISTVSKAPQ
jgi:hypothetical protein